MNPDEPLYTADEAMGWHEAVLTAIITVAVAAIVGMVALAAVALP